MTRILTLLTAAVALISSATLASPQREREVVFNNGQIKLAGTLLLPAGEAPHNAAVLVHGSGPGPRGGLRFLADRLVEQGLAILIFDKRGSGASSGAWYSATLDDLADDVLAAVAFVRQQSEVADRRVGVCGVSQGGWVIPRAAIRRANGFDFAIIVTGGGLKPADVERHDYAMALDAAKVTPEKKREGLALVEQYLAYLKTGEGRAPLLEKIESSRHEPLGSALNLDRVMPDEASRAKWSWVPDYDPANDIRQMRVPLLVMLGGRDRPTLTNEMIQRWHANLSENQAATMIEILGAAHGMTLPGTHHVGTDAQQYIRGYIEMVGAWLHAQQLVK
jgi:pimeloyl-ACP methyl ester carboxylesterase